MLWKCKACGYISEGDAAPDKCPKCGAPAQSFEQLSEDDAKKIYMSDRTNDIHHEIAELAAKIVKLCEEGIDIDLDPGCIAAFKGSQDRAWEIKQMVKAEIATHVGKGKY